MKVPRSPMELEQFVRIKGLRPVEKIPYRGQYIYIAETDLEQGDGYDWGYYQTAWFIGTDDKFDGGSWVEFDAMHDADKEWTPETKRIARQNEAIRKAKEYIDATTH